MKRRNLFKALAGAVGAGLAVVFGAERTMPVMYVKGSGPSKNAVIHTVSKRGTDGRWRTRRVNCEVKQIFELR